MNASLPTLRNALALLLVAGTLAAGGVAQAQFAPPSRTSTSTSTDGRLNGLWVRPISNNPPTFTLLGFAPDGSFAIATVTQQSSGEASLEKTEAQYSADGRKFVVYENGQAILEYFYEFEGDSLFVYVDEQTGWSEFTKYVPEETAPAAPSTPVPPPRRGKGGFRPTVQPASHSSIDSRLVGTWTAGGQDESSRFQVTLTLQGDGRFTMVLSQAAFGQSPQTQTAQGTVQVSGDQLVLSFDNGNTMTMPYAFRDGGLSLQINGEWSYFVPAK